VKLLFAVLPVALAVSAMSGAETSSRYSPREKANYADPKLVQGADFAVAQVHAQY